MHKSILIVAAAFAFVSSGCFAQVASADEAPVIYHRKSVRHICHDFNCGHCAPCGARCNAVCSDRYIFHPLYGAYGPYGGVSYWGAYTFSGWGRRW